VAGSPYSIVPSSATGGTFNPGNYTISYVNGTLTVTATGLTVTVVSTNACVGAPIPLFTVVLVGLTNNDNITAGATSTATASSPPGVYPITPALVDPAGRLPNYVVVTNVGELTINSCGSSTLVVLNPSFSGQVFSLSFQSEQGTGYTLQFKNALTDPNWSDLETVAGNGGILTLTDPNATVPSRIYRVQSTP
jgi:hypothetical protein